MKYISKSILTAGLLGVFSIASGPLCADDINRKPLALEDIPNEPTKFEAEGELITMLKLGDDSDATRVEFYALPDGYGDSTVGIMEINKGNFGLEDFPRLNKVTNPRELFHAFARKGAIEPALFVQKFEKPRIGNAGWAREAMDKMPAMDSASKAVCNWTNFKNSFNNFRPDINGTKLWFTSVNGDHDTAGGDYYTHPWQYTWWLNYASNARTLPWNNQYHNYTFYNVDKYKTKVRVCAFKTGNQYQDRYVRFRYRTENNASAGSAYFKELTTNDIGTTFSWYWPASGSSLKNWDWVTLVGGSTVYPYSHPNDKFYVAVQKK